MAKLDKYKYKTSKGETLNQDQLEALSRYHEVIHNLEFARELHKSFFVMGQVPKKNRKTVRRENMLRAEVDKKKFKRVLELQFVLQRLRDESVRQEFLQGAEGLPVLTDADFTALEEFHKLVEPERDTNLRLTDQYQEASWHFWDVMEGKDKPVAGSTYKVLKATLEQLFESGYFDRVQTHQNGVCAEEEEQAAAVKVPEVKEHPADKEGEMPEEYTKPIPIAPTEFVNRQLISETTYSTRDQEQRKEWSAKTQVVKSMQQPVQASPTPVVPKPHPLTTVKPTPPSDPLIRKRVVQDLMAQMQGPYSFMQDSMLEFDGQALDPAIVSAQPMKPAPSMDMPPMVCQPAHTDSHLAQPPAVAIQPEPTQASMPLTEQAPPTTDLPPASKTQFQSGSKPLHSGGINVNAAPFQSMQTVFNLNAPVPQANDTDAMKQTRPYQNSYNQGFNSQTQPPFEQTNMPPEQLQSVVGAFHPQDQSLPNSTGHQPMSQQPSGQGNGFNRQAQSFYNSRGMSRGGPRNSRGVINGYRGPSNGFRGGYDGYRPPFSNSANPGYGQPQFSTPRDYSSSNYQRDGYQQNYKRGAAQGSRGVPRGNAPAMRS